MAIWMVEEVQGRSQESLGWHTQSDVKRAGPGMGALQRRQRQAAGLLWRGGRKEEAGTKKA